MQCRWRDGIFGFGSQLYLRDPFAMRLDFADGDDCLPNIFARLIEMGLQFAHALAQ